MAKSYPIALAGCGMYQDAIAAIGVGEVARFFHEADNPYDDRAIAAVCHGDTIGYVPRGSWLTRALLKEEKPVSARVTRVAPGREGVRFVTLTIELDVGDPVEQRAYEAA